MSQLGVAPTDIHELLRAQGLVEYAGDVRIGDEHIRINPTGEFKSVKEIGDLLIRSNTTGKLIPLRSVATVTRGYQEVPKFLMRYQNHPALGIGLSFASGTNVVAVGEALSEKVQSIESLIPVGVELHPIYMQPTIVTDSVNGFVVSLLQALAIVVLVLLMFMGLRSGLIIGAILFLTVLATLFIMYLAGISLERISLGALIISLGMLVDNAIVVTEGILVGIKQGVDRIRAAKDTVAKTMWPLLGATLVGILAFAPIGLSQDSTGEYTRSLFYVIFISLSLSWIFAITVAPLFCYYLIKSEDKPKGDVYGGWFFRFYKGFLLFCLRRSLLTVGVMVALLAASIYGFQYVKQSFFPDSTTPIFYIDYWRAQGTDIRETSREMGEIEKHIMSMKDVETVTTVVGNGATRFMLVYTPEKENSSYGQFIIEVKNYNDIDRIGQEILDYLAVNYPDSEPKMKRIRLGPGKDAKIEIRISGSDPEVLRQLSEQAQDIMREQPSAINIRDDWRHREKILRPIYADAQARRTGITRGDMNKALANTFSGLSVGVYREKDKLLPIITRPPDVERLNVSTIRDLQIWSPLLLRYVPITQITNGFSTEWEDSMVRRRNRLRTITASCDPKVGLAAPLFEKLRPTIEAMSLPNGYRIEWGGEYEDSRDAQMALAAKLPGGVLAMILVVFILFAKVRQPVIIWLCVPLSFIGVTIGLLVTGSEFGFMALLGFLSLSGMLIKNAVVLVDQIDLEIDEGKSYANAIIDSSIGRLRPVSLAAITTVLGMIPLLPDIFFRSMAVVIMFGLSFATVLTLIVVPVLYGMFFRVSFKDYDKTPVLEEAQ